MNVISYIKNVGKSFGYVAVDVFKEYNPAATALAKSAKELSSDLYQSIGDFKSNLSSKKSEQSLTGQGRDILSDLKTNIFEDLKSGNWYNKQRIDNVDLEGFGGFSFDDDFGDFDFEFEDDIDNSSKAEISQDQKSTKEIISSMDVIGAKTANAISTASVKSADYIVASQRESTKALYGITNRGFDQVTKGIAALNSNISILSSIAEPMNIHMQNSSLFYTKSSEYQEKSLKLLEQLVQNTSPKSASGTRSANAKNTINDLMMDGAIDLQAYFDMIKSNTKDMLSMFTSFFGMGSGKDIKNAITKSPISSAMKIGMNALMPKVMKNAMGEFNSFLDGYFATMLGSLKDKNFKNPIFNFLKDIIVPKSGYKNKIDTGNYNKGKVDWDGMSRKALMDVIPYQLSQIVAAVTGQPQKIFDYRTGKWKTISSIKTEYNDFKNRYADNADHEFINEIKEVIKELKSQNKYSEEQAKTMMQQLVQFNRNAFHSDNSEFMNFMNDNFNYSKFGMDKATWEMMRQYTKSQNKSGKRSQRLNYTGNIMRERSKFGDAMRGIEAEGSIFNVLFDDSIDESEKSRTLLGVDEYNNDIFFYLQGIYQHTQHVSENLELFAPVGSTIQGASIQSGGSIKPIRKIRKRASSKEVEKKRQSISSDMIELSASEIYNATNKVSGSRNNKFSKYKKELQQYLIDKESHQIMNQKFEINEKYEREIEEIDRLEDAKKSFSNNMIVKSVKGFSESLLKIFNIPADSITKFIDSAEVSMSNLIFGSKEEGEQGILDLAKNGFTDLFDKLGDKLNSIFPVDELKSIWNKIFGKKGEDGKRSGSIFSGFANETASELRKAGNWVKNVFTGQNQFNGNAYNGRKVTKTGIVAVSEGEMIIPAELNPFYHKKINKKKQIANENTAISRFFGSYANGTTAVGENGIGETSNIYSNSILGNGKQILTEGGKTLASGVKNFINAILPDSKGIEEEKKKIAKVAESALDSIGEAKGSMAAGAIIGGGVSLLTGGLVGPILGAGIGAATGLIIRSKSVQKALFGYTDKDGEHEGLLNKNIAQFMQKNVPSMAKGAAVGGTAGLFMGSPVLGAILGSTVGYISSSEKAKGVLFGHGDIDDGLISKELQNKLKKALPNMSAGAIAGLVAGPFGLAGNILVGSAVGYATSTNKFQKWLFGDKDNKDDKGFAGLLKDNLINPLVGIFDNVAQELKHVVRNTFHNLGKVIRKTMLNFFKGKIGGRVGRTAGKVANFVTGGGVRLAGKMLKGINNKFTGRSLRKGYSLRNRAEGRNMTAAERMERRLELGQENNGIFGTLDQILDNTQSPEELNDLRNLTNMMIDPTKEFDKRIMASRNRTQNLLRNSRSSVSGKENLKSYDKISNKVYKKMNAHKYDEALALLNTLPVDESTKEQLRNEINEHKNNYSGSKSSLANAKEAKKKLIQDSKWAKIPGIEKLVNLDDGDLMNLQDLIKDEKNGRNFEEKREENQYTTITKTIPDLLGDILGVLVRDPDTLEKVRGNRFESNDLQSRANNMVREATEVGNFGVEESNHIYFGPNLPAYNSEPKEGDTKTDLEGNKMIYTNNEWIYDESDTSTKENIKKEENIYNAIMTLPNINSGISGMGGLFGKLHDKLFGTSDGESKGLLGNLSSGIASIAKSIIPGLALINTLNGNLDGFWHKLGFGGNPENDTITSDANYEDAQGNTVTKDEDGNFVDENGNFVDDRDVYVSDSQYAKSITPFSSNMLLNEARQLLTRGDNLTTKFIKRLPGGKKLLNGIGTKIGKNIFNKSTKSLSKKGIGSFFNEAGELLFDEDNADNIAQITKKKGKLFGRKGKYVFETVENVAEGATENAGKFAKFKNLFNIKNIGTVKDYSEDLTKKAAENAGKEAAEKIGKNSTKDMIEKTAKNVTEKTVKEAAESGTRKSVKEAVEKGIKTFFDNMSKLSKYVPDVGKLVKALDLDGLCKKLTKSMTQNVAESSARAVADAAYAFPPLGVALDIIFFVGDFTHGYQDARSILGIVTEPHFGWKCISGFLEALIGLIPFVGPLIPIDMVIDVFVDFVVPALNTILPAPISIDEFKKLRTQAKDEVVAYNEAHGTDYDIAEYNKKVLNDYTWGESIINDAKDGWNRTWHTTKKVGSDIFSGDFSGAIDSIVDDNNKYKYDEICKRLEIQLREQMRAEEGKIDEERLMLLLDWSIQRFLNSDKGKKYYKFYYGEEYTDAKRSKFEQELKNMSETDLASYEKYVSESETYHKTTGLKKDNYGTYYVPVGGLNGSLTSALNIQNITESAMNKVTQAASGSGLAGGSSFISQLDKKYANMSLGTSDVQSKGCGPAAAVMALNQYAGNANMNSAVSLASNYQSSAGTDAAFFADYYRRNGKNAVYYDGTSSAGRSNIINSINQGVPVILMGQDSKNRSKSNSPFGPNNHYVVASGFDGAGNIIINDPEAKNGNKKYSSKILKNVKLGVGIGGAGSYLIKKFGIAGGSTYSHGLRNDSVTQAVWAFFKNRGYSDAAVAGIMGNLQQESGIDPTRHQTNGTARGIAQWEGGRFTELTKFANSRGKDWTDFDSQLCFIDQELNGSQKWGFTSKANCTFEQFKCMTDVADATVAFEKAFERAGKPNFDKRIEYAAYYYNEFSGKTYVYDGSIGSAEMGTSTSSTSSSSSSNTESTGKNLGILGTITSAFSKIGDIFNGSSEETENSESSGNNTAANIMTATAANIISGNPTGINFAGKDPVDVLRSIKGKLQYSMDENSPRNPEVGIADCSSTVQWAIKKATGIDIGNSTLTQYNNSNLETVWYGGGKVASQLPANIKENDILFFSRPNSNFTAGRQDRVGHVELYSGDGNMIGHGSNGGPKEKSVPLGVGENGGLIKVARLVGQTAASGSGLIDASRLKGSSKLLYANNINNSQNYINTSIDKYKYGRLYAGGESALVNTSNRNKKISNNKTSTMSKDVALLLRTIITLVESIVTNTNDIHNIYTTLCQLIDKGGFDNTTASSAKEAISQMGANSSNSKIEEQLSGLKATVDSILAG